MAFKPQRVRDPVHNLIRFHADQFENALWSVIETRPFQRLRRIKQLGFSDLVYPGATHSRFAHSLGVFHTARMLMQIIQTHLGPQHFEPTKAQAALAASLVHDLGHGPFSHAFEDVGRRLGLKMASHEHVSDSLIRTDDVAEAFSKLGSGFAADVADIINRKGPKDIYDAVVSSQFDADRLDYMQRDRLMSGTQVGGIDFAWLIENLEIGTVPYGVDDTKVGDLETFVVGSKAVDAAEGYVLGLFQLYPTIYFHKTTRGAEKLFTEILIRIVELAREGSIERTGLSDTHPIAIFANKPDEIESVLALDDSVIWGSLPLLVEARDETIRLFSSNLRDRNLFMAIDVRERLKSQMDGKLDEAESLDRACDQVCVRIEEAVIARSLEAKGRVPSILSDKAEREPYRRFQESKGPLNQIRVKSPNGGLVDLGERSKVVGAIQTFKLYRLYVARDDQEAQRFVADLIKREAAGNVATH